MKILKLVLFTMLLSQSIIALAQNSKNTFDFWVGEWDAYWNDSLKGSNFISMILDRKAVEENFSSNDRSFAGRSWSVFDSANNIWKQTWVDNSGAYMSFTGGQEGNDVALYAEEKKDKNGEPYYLRMIFQNIEKDSFSWKWQRSRDKIEWNNSWEISYKRKSL